MEGGYFPWKNQSVEVVDEIDSLNKPLPSPPSGSVWSRDTDGSWVLIEVGPSTNAAVRTASDPDVIIHEVQPGDTLQGICLRYGVSIMEVRRVNMFSNNSIQHFKTLRIPLKKGIPVVGEVDEGSRQAILQKFQAETKESIAESRIYLEDNDWNLDLALGAWRGDENWESSQSPHSFGCDDPAIDPAVVARYRLAEGNSSKKFD